MHALSVPDDRPGGALDVDGEEVVVRLLRPPPYLLEEYLGEAVPLGTIYDITSAAIHLELSFSAAAV